MEDILSSWTCMFQTMQTYHRSQTFTSGLLVELNNLPFIVNLHQWVFCCMAVTPPTYSTINAQLPWVNLTDKYLFADGRAERRDSSKCTCSPLAHMQQWHLHLCPCVSANSWDVITKLDIYKIITQCIILNTKQLLYIISWECFLYNKIEKED